MSQLKYTREQITAVVNEKIKEINLHLMQDYFHENSKVKLWGLEKPRSFENDMVLLTLYKDLYGHSFHHIADEIDFHYKLTEHSIRHNIPLVRNVLSGWANGEITLGNLHDWKAAARHGNFGELVQDSNLWIDSSDFKIVNSGYFKPKSAEWSFKENAPAQRYMVVSDAKGKIRKVWGGYSPKLHDGTFLSNNKESIELLLKDGVVLGDNHFSKGKKLFKNVKFYTNYAIRDGGNKGKKRKTTEDPEAEDYVDNIKKSEEKFNKQQQAARGRIESPFGIVKKKFKSLDQPYYESAEQMDNTVMIAFAVMNKNLN